MTKSKSQILKPRQRRANTCPIPPEPESLRVLRRFLTDLDLWDATRPMRQFLTSPKLRGQKLTMRLATSCPGGDAEQRLWKAMHRVLNERNIRLGTWKSRYSPQEVVAYLAPFVQQMCRAQPSHADVRSEALLRIVREALEPLSEAVSLDNLFGMVWAELVAECSRHSDLESKLFHINQPELADADNQPRVDIELHSAIPEKRSFRVDGSSRPAVRCSNLGTGRPLQWISWNSQQLRLSGPPRDLPVYIQNHALGRLFGSDGRLQSLLETGQAEMILLFADSLLNPMAVASDGPQDSLLIEFGHDDYKLGYLVALVLPDAVLIRTFLFLTMDGTPEGDEIRRRLRANRHDKAYVGLDCLETIIDSDIAQDVVLRQVFRACRCDHLFDVARVIGDVKTGRAAEIRHYFRLDEAVGRFNRSYR